MTLTQLQDTLKKSGVIGAGGAGFPSYAKLSDKADTILLNCAECEPLLTLHRQLLAEKTFEILTALKIIADVLNVKKTIVCIKEEYEETVSSVKNYLPEFEKTELKLLDSVYPMGDEVVLIYETLKRRVPPGGIPINIGVIVFNVETIYNVYCALKENKPVTHKYVTITGAVKQPKTVKVPIGTKISELVRIAGGLNISDEAYLVGGPMMGFVGSKDTSVNKTTNAVIVLPKSHKLIRAKDLNHAIGINRASSVCCQCMACTDLCPRSNLGYPIKPHLFMRAISNNEYTNTDVFLNTFFCCGCGICEKFACPQSLAPSTLIGAFKNKLRSSGVKMPTGPTGKNLAQVAPHREYRAVPEKRLEMSIDLHSFNSSAKLDETTHDIDINKVFVNINTHIGAPLTATVKEGQDVKCGDVIAENENDSALSATLHAPISGKVAFITKNQIIIEKA